MKKTLLTTALSLLLAPVALAHPGHDHTHTPGGELHHVLWIGLGLAATAGAMLWAYRRSRHGRK